MYMFNSMLQLVEAEGCGKLPLPVLCVLVSANITLRSIPDKDKRFTWDTSLCVGMLRTYTHTLWPAVKALHTASLDAVPTETGDVPDLDDDLDTLFPSVTTTNLLHRTVTKQEETAYCHLLMSMKPSVFVTTDESKFVSEMVERHWLFGEKHEFGISFADACGDMADEEERHGASIRVFHIYACSACTHLVEHWFGCRGGKDEKNR
jgi:hypothetical protein